MAVSDPKDWSKSLHDARGSGSGSRTRLNTLKLKQNGWTILSRESGEKVHFTYIDPEGRKFISTKDVERKLDADGTLGQFLSGESAVEKMPTVEAVEDTEESDEDYEPPFKQRVSLDVLKSG